MKNILRFILIVAAILLLMFACAVMADGPKPPYASPFSQSLFTNTTQAGWQSALGVGGGGTTNANTARALYYPSVSAYPLVYTNTGGQPDALFLPLSIAAQGASGDYAIPIIIPNPLGSSCGGFFFPMFTTNAGTGRSVWSILANGQSNYLHDLKAGQIGAVPENSSDIGGGTIGMFNDPNYPFAFGGFISGFENHWMYEDPTNALLQFPLASTTAGRDARVAPSVMVIDQKQNFVVVTNQIKLGSNLFIGYGVAGVSGGAGIPVFTNANGGGIPFIDPTVISPLGALSITNLTINAPNLVNAISFGGATYMQRTGGGGDISFLDNNGEYLRLGGLGGDNFLSMRTTGSIGWNTDGAGNIGSSGGASSGLGRPGIVYVKNGVGSSVSNSTVFSLTMPATTVNFTNTNSVSWSYQIDNTAVTGTVVKKNGVQVFSGLTTDITLLLRPGETFSETYTIGTPVLTGQIFP